MSSSISPPASKSRCSICLAMNSLYSKLSSSKFFLLLLSYFHASSKTAPLTAFSICANKYSFLPCSGSITSFCHQRFQILRYGPFTRNSDEDFYSLHDINFSPFPQPLHFIPFLQGLVPNKGIKCGIHELLVLAFTPFLRPFFPSYFVHLKAPIPFSTSIIASTVRQSGHILRISLRFPEKVDLKDSTSKSFDSTASRALLFMYGLSTFGAGNHFILGDH